MGHVIVKVLVRKKPFSLLLQREKWTSWKKGCLFTSSTSFSSHGRSTCCTDTAFLILFISLLMGYKELGREIVFIIICRSNFRDITFGDPDFSTFHVWNNEKKLKDNEEIYVYTFCFPTFATFETQKQEYICIFKYKWCRYKEKTAFSFVWGPLVWRMLFV